MSIDPAIRPRRHDLTGVYNFRDVGGYAAESGSVRWGKLFRSDALHRLDDAGRAHLGRLGVSHVVDLRSQEERVAAPNAVGGLPATTHHLPVFAGAAPVSAATEGITRVYEQIVDERGSALVDAVRTIAGSREEEAVVVHCTAGKDRTGLVVALTLSLVGVARESVVADYAATEENLRGAWADEMVGAVRARGIDPSPALLELLTASPAPVMEATLERMAGRHGSIQDYAFAHGLTERELDLLRDGLIERS